MSKKEDDKIGKRKSIKNRKMKEIIIEVGIQ